MLHLKLPLLVFFFIKLQKIWISLIYDFILHSINLIFTTGIICTQLNCEFSLNKFSFIKKKPQRNTQTHRLLLREIRARQPRLDLTHDLDWPKGHDTLP